MPPQTLPRILVAGLGNIFLGDDAFGVEVAQRLAACGLPDGARVVDFGIRGLDLTYALLDGYETIILVDAAPRGGQPGTLYVLELDLGEPAAPGEGALVDAHHLDPVKVLSLAASLGAQIGRLILVGCEPTQIDESEDFGTGMSAAALAAVDEAVPLITALVARLLCGEAITAAQDGIFSLKEAESCSD